MSLPGYSHEHRLSKTIRSILSPITSAPGLPGHPYLCCKQFHKQRQENFLLYLVFCHLIGMCWCLSMIFFKKNFFPLLLPWFLVVLADSFLHSSLKILTFVLLVFLKFFLLKCLKIYPKLSWTQRQRGKLSGKVAKWNSHPMVKQAFVGMLSAGSNTGGSLYLLWSISYIEWYMASHDQCITVEGAWTKRLKWLF